CSVAYAQSTDPVVGVGRLSSSFQNWEVIVKRISFVFACLCIVLGLAAATTKADADNFHSFVSANGTGTTCTFQAPCSDITTAINATVSGGVVSCSDQGGNSSGSTFAPISITKSITIDCAGTSAASWFITINGSGIVVTLRNLIVTAANFATSIGIDF